MTVSIALTAMLGGAGHAGEDRYAALTADLAAKGEACTAITPRTDQSIDCIVACRASVRTLETSARLSGDHVRATAQKCDDAHAAAGLIAPHAPVPDLPPSEPSPRAGRAR